MNREEGAPAPAGTRFLAARAALARLDRLSYGAVVVAMASMALIVAVQVFFRYALGSSIDSADELARLFFVWAMFLAIPHGVRRGAHFGVRALVDRLPADKRLGLYRLNCILAAALMSLVFAATLPVIAGKWSELMPTLEITAAVYYIAVLAAAGHSCLHLLLLAWGGPDSWEDGGKGGEPGP